jgi:hypothetical protein
LLILDLAESHPFDVFITADKNLQYQQNLESRLIRIADLKSKNARLLSTGCSAMFPMFSFPTAAVDENDNLSNYLPVGVSYRSESHTCSQLGAIHQPRAIFSGGSIAPQDVHLTIVVVVACTANAPVNVCYTGNFYTCSQLGTIHQPYAIFSGGSIAPQDVYLTIAVEVTCTADVPVSVCHGGKFYTCCQIGTIHQPHDILSGGTISP